jgi:hypothetical protein
MVLLLSFLLFNPNALIVTTPHLFQTYKEFLPLDSVHLIPPIHSFNSQDRALVGIKKSLDKKKYDSMISFGGCRVTETCHLITNVQHIIVPTTWKAITRSCLQPKDNTQVSIDLSVLDTLPEPVYQSGILDIINMADSYPKFLNWLEQNHSCIQNRQQKVLHHMVHCISKLPRDVPPQLEINWKKFPKKRLRNCL